MRGGGGYCAPLQVTAILLLFGYPRLLTGSILAHEVLHAFFRLSHKAGRRFPPRGMPARLEEGLCQLAAWCWLRDAGAAAVEGGAAAAPARTPLNFFAYAVESDTSPVYGAGFRDALRAFRRLGSLPAVLAEVEERGALPAAD